MLIIASNLDCVDTAATTDRLARDIERWQHLGLTSFVTLRSERGPAMADFLNMLEAAAKIVTRAGLTPLTQNHVGGVIESPEDLLGCTETGVGLHFDTQQFLMAGADPLHAWDQLGAHVMHAHLGDRDVRNEPCAFGQGLARMGALLERMHASGYRGALTLETEHGREDEAAKSVVGEAMTFTQDILEPLGAMGAVASPGHARFAAGSLPVVDAQWGRLHWIANSDVFAGCNQTIGLVTIHPGQTNGRHRHPDDQEVVYVQSGRCRHACGDRDVALGPGDVLFIPQGQVHGAINTGDVPLELVVTYPTGARSFEKIQMEEIS